MLGNFYPPEGHDFVGSAEIRALGSENQNRLEAKYHDDAQILRADVMLKLDRHNALAPGLSWAVFDIPGDEPDENGLVSTLPMRHRDSLLYTGRSSVDGASVLRITANEVVMFGAETILLSEDFTLLGNNDCMYLLDIHVPSCQDEAQGSTVPIFAIDVETAELKVNDAISENLTQRFRVSYDFNPNRYVTPYGDISCLEDKIFALSKGRELLAEVLHLEPSFRAAE